MYLTDPTLYGATLPRRDIPFTPPFMNPQFMQQLPWQGISPFLPFQNVGQQLPWQGAQRFLPVQKSLGYGTPLFGQGVGYDSPYAKQELGYRMPYVPQGSGYETPLFPALHGINMPFCGWQNPWVG